MSLPKLFRCTVQKQILEFLTNEFVPSIFLCAIQNIVYVVKIRINPFVTKSAIEIIIFNGPNKETGQPNFFRVVNLKKRMQILRIFIPSLVKLFVHSLKLDIFEVFICIYFQYSIFSLLNSLNSKNKKNGRL